MKLEDLTLLLCDSAAAVVDSAAAVVDSAAVLLLILLLLLFKAAAHSTATKMHQGNCSKILKTIRSELLMGIIFDYLSRKINKK
jgi:hypothetical protein